MIMLHPRQCVGGFVLFVNVKLHLIHIYSCLRKQLNPGGGKKNSRKASSSTASQEISFILWNPKTH
jgi:hypothetical protein